MSDSVTASEGYHEDRMHRIEHADDPVGLLRCLLDLNHRGGVKLSGDFFHHSELVAILSKAKVLTKGKM